MAYYEEDDLQRFDEIGKHRPDLFEKFMAWYQPCQEEGALSQKGEQPIMLMKRLLTLAFVVWSMACSLGQTAVDHTPAAQTGSREKPVAVGELAPDFTLEDQNNNSVTLSNSRDKNPVVLVFYRGYW